MKGTAVIIPEVIKRNELDSFAALMVAQATPLRKLKGERDTEFVKRIVCAYFNAVGGLGLPAIRETGT